MHSFQYEKLSSASTEFRLIRLKPTTAPDHTICCLIEHYPQLKCPPYFALSYVWGNPNFRNRIQVNGKDAYITDSLHEALRAMCDENVEKYVWADALCINQHDNDEKSLQVQCMRDIYLNAYSVVSWLGNCSYSNETSDTYKRLNTIGERSMEYHGADALSAYIKATRENDLTKAAQKWEEAQHIYKTVSTLCETGDNYPYAQFAGLTRVPYWTRVWIVQEHSIPRRLHYLRGRFCLSADSFRGLLFFHAMWYMDSVQKLTRFPTMAANSDILAMSIGMGCSSMCGARKEYQTQPEGATTNTLFDNCVRANVQADPAPPLQASNPEDRIYALLGMSSDRSLLNIPVNFRLKLQEVYTETARAWLSNGIIRFLVYCQAEHVPVDWPSWVPDWRGPLRRPICDYEHTNRFCAAGKSSQVGEYVSVGLGSLRIQCIIVDNIIEIGSKWNPELNTDAQGNYIFNYTAAADFLSNIETFVQKAAKVESTYGVFSKIVNPQEASWRVPVADQEQPPMGQYRRATAFSHEGYEQVKRGIELGKDEQGKYHEAKSGYINMMGYLFNRRPVLSSKGLVGAGPGNTKTNDKIVIFPGCYAPFVIRRKEASSDFQLVGEAYVYGIMDGEVLEDKDMNIVSIVIQ